MMQTHKYIAFGLFCICLTGISHAQLPRLDQQDLANLIQAGEMRIQKVQVKYQLTYGTVKGNDVLFGEFVPQVPPYTVDGEWAYDSISNSEYLREDMLQSDGSIHKQQYAYDGNIGTKLAQSEPGSEEWYGRIQGDRPDRLKDTSGHWRPSWSTYGAIPGYTLSSAVGNAEKVKIASDNIDGLDTYKIELEVAYNKEVQFEGKMITGKTFEKYRLWLSPEKNMLPVRIDKIQPQLLAEEPEHLLFSRRQSDFREIGPGVWFPFSSRYHRVFQRTVDVVIDSQVDSLALNDSAIVKSRLEFPPGTYVRDEVKDIRYRVISPGVKTNLDSETDRPKGNGLDFRILPNAVGSSRYPISPFDYPKYVEELKNHGPEYGKDYAWLPIELKVGSEQPHLVEQEYEGRMYVLASNKESEVMLDDGSWNIILVDREREGNIGNYH